MINNKFVETISIVTLLIILTSCSLDKDRMYHEYSMECKIDSDCAADQDCRSKAGGGTECRRIATNNPLPNSTQFPLVTKQESPVTQLNLKELPEAIRTEQEVRIKRLAYLSERHGAQLPQLNEDLQIAAGAVSGINYPIPVIRIRYEERTFFDFNETIVRPESIKILDVIANQMNDDMPDTSLVILGHTDSTGSDEYNTILSLERATVVMKELAKRGVNIEQMSTVGIGESQPIATNATENGRALNRRVEFLLSRFSEANYIAIEKFPRNIAWINNHADGQVPLKDSKSKSLAVLKLNDSAMPSKMKKTKQKINATELPVITQPLKESNRVVTLIPAEKITVEVLPN